MASGLWSDARWVRQVEETLGEWFAEVSAEVPPERWLEELSELLWEWHREGVTLPEGQVNALERWIADEQAAARGATNSDVVREKPVEAEDAGDTVELASVTQSKSPSTSVADDADDSAKFEEAEPEQPPTNDRSVLGGAPGAFGLYFHFLVDPLTKGVEAIGDQFQTVRNQVQEGKTGEAVQDSLAFGMGIAAENVPDAALSPPVSALFGLAKDEAQSRWPLAYERGRSGGAGGGGGGGVGGRGGR